jgi:hypothetical protein
MNGNWAGSLFPIPFGKKDLGHTSVPSSFSSNTLTQGSTPVRRLVGVGKERMAPGQAAYVPGQGFWLER